MAIVNSGDVEQLYYALLNVFESPVKHDQMGIRSLEKIQRNFSVDKAVNGFLLAIKYARGKVHGNNYDAN